MSDEQRLDGPGREVEGGGQSSGLPAAGVLVNAHEPLARPGRRHWRESTITQPGLDDRGNVFFAAVEMTRMPIILTDPNTPDNVIVFANKAFLDLTEYEEGEVLDRNCRFLQGSGTSRETVDELRTAIAAREAVSVEILNYKRDGTPFWNAVFIGPVYDVGGELLYFFASQLDVTRRRNSELAQRQSQKMESIGQLTAGLAHDFNNLLQVVNGNLDLLAAQELTDRQRRYVDTARMAGERGAKLTGQLLAFARKTRLDPRAVDLSDLILQFGDLLESTLGNRIELQLNLRRRLPAVMLDADNFEMTLLNVLVNARDAMPRGGTVTITTGTTQLTGDEAARFLPPGDYITVEVRDEGEGMTADVLDRAVEPFFSTKGVGRGTGLGLAMANGFLQQSRGRLEIDSAVGQGTTIRMLFPVVRDAVAAIPQSPQPAGALSLDQGGHEHILIVEDSPEVLALAQEILEARGYRIATAADGEQGLALFEAAQAGDDGFDLVFTDLVMPGGINGIMLARKIAERAPDLPVLMTTGYNEELVADGPDRSDMDVIGKPYRPNELADRIRQALNRAGPAGPRRNRSDFGAAEG